MIREKVLSLLPPATQSWVQAQEPESAAKVAQLADSYRLNHPEKVEPARKWMPRPDRGERSAHPHSTDSDRKSPPPTVQVKQEQTKLPSYDPVKGYRCYQCQQFGH